MRPKREIVLGGAALSLTACLNLPLGGTEAADDLPGDHACSPRSSIHGPDDPVDSAPIDASAQFPWDEEQPRVADGFAGDEHIFVLGGDPGEGIPALDEPCFEPVSGEVDWLEPQSPVLAIEVDDQARAYPLAILHYHEIVNDLIGGEPVAVTYCPLCNSGLAFDRSVDGRVLDFAVSGRLYQSNLVMYDRQTRSLWLQFTGEAISGEPYVGRTLERIPTWLVSWDEFGEAHPDGWVLTRETGYERDYDFNPYAGYADAPPPAGHDPYFGNFGKWPEVGVELKAKSRVVGLSSEVGDDAVAIPLESLSEVRQTTVELDGKDVLVLWAPGKADALDTARLDDGRDIGQVGTYIPQASVEGRQANLTITPDPGDNRRFVDEETNSTWTILGHAIDGPLQGTRLQPVARDDTLWSVWFSFHPSTRVHAPS